MNKLYNCDVDKVNTFYHKGKLMRHQNDGNKYRKHDYKKMMLKTKFQVPVDFQ
jgi:ribosomal protein L23